MNELGLDDVLTGLTAVYSTVATWPADGDGIAVFDGPQRTEAPRRFLCVGYDGSPQAPVEIMFRSASADLQDMETYQVSCLLSYWIGDETSPALRAALVALYRQFDAALAEDRTLGDVAMMARATQAQYRPSTQTEGDLAQLRWTVVVQTMN